MDSHRDGTQGFWEDGDFYSYNVEDEEEEEEDLKERMEIEIKEEVPEEIALEPESMESLEESEAAAMEEEEEEQEQDGEDEDQTGGNAKESPRTVLFRNDEEINVSELYKHSLESERTWKDTVKRTRHRMVFDREKMKGLAVENHRFYAMAIIDMAAQLQHQYPDNVQMGVEIDNSKFDTPFCFHLRPIAHYRENFIERELDTRMQSAKELTDPGEELDVTLTFAVPLSGSGKPRLPTLELMKKMSKAPNLFGQGGGTVGGARSTNTSPSKRQAKIINNAVSSHCLATAVCQGIAKIEWQILPPGDPNKHTKHLIWRRWKTVKFSGGQMRTRQELWQEAVQLLVDSGVTRTADFTMEDVGAIQHHLKGRYQLLVFNANFHGSDPIFKGPYVDRERIIPLQLKDSHFQLISSINSFMATTYYCTFCFKGTGSAQLHYKCPLKCSRCLRENCPRDGGVVIKCATCRITFKSQDCYNAHQAPGTSGGRSRCAVTAYCKKCQESYYKDHGHEHVCGQKYCSQCRQTKGPGHKHVLSELKARKEYRQKRIFFDAETRVVDLGPGKKEHSAVHISALRSCPACRHVVPKNRAEGLQLLCGECSADDFGNPGQRLFEFTQVDPGEEDSDVLEKFGNWLFCKKHSGFTAIAHNLKGFDGQLMLQYLLRKDRPTPDKLVLAGRKLNFLEVGGIRVLDSYNFVPFALATFSKSFDVKELKKGDFPFKFISTQNYGYVGPVPSKDMYDYESKTEDAKKRFDEDFYVPRLASNTPFNFRSELKEYCFADVVLLAEAMRKFEDSFFKLTNVMLFEECVTSASAAMAVFRRNFLTRDSMVLDSDPSSRRLKQSSVARRFLAYLQSEEQEDIISANNVGEFKIPGTNYHVDGYIEKCPAYPQGKVIEYKGCYYHMHHCSYDDDQMTTNGERAIDVRRRDADREAKIRQFCPVIDVYWGCEVYSLAKRDKKLAGYLEKNLDYGPAVGLEALFGGRTEPIRLRKQKSSNSVIRYMDFTSLYPFVMKTCEYPVGEACEIMGRSIPCPISTPNELRDVCRGYMSCKVLPPQKLFLPVLPLRGDKLLFALCGACANLAGQQEKVPNPCPHTGEERCLTGTWTTVELALALEKGYRIEAVYGAVHWPADKWSKYQKDGDNIEHGLFSQYINTFLKLKQEASGYPANVTTEEEKDKYIESYYQKEEIRMEKANIKKDPVMRQISKLLLNSLWGKFGERIDKVKTEVVTEPNQLHKIINNPAVEISAIHIHNDHAITVQTRAVEGALNALPTSALPYAILTTAHARVRLYKALDMIPNPEENILYMDTDSVIYSSDASSPNPLQSLCGDYLGELTDEIESGMEISDFATVGAKSYAYKVTSTTDPTASKIHLKAKGFPKTGDMEMRINMELMKKQVDAVIDRQKKLAANPDADIPDVPIASVRYHQIRTDVNHRLLDKSMAKIFRFTFDKRHITAEGGTLPYGYQ